MYMNKTLLKLAGVSVCFSVINVLVTVYWLARCGQTSSPFYCDAFEFGGLFFLLGIPALILFGIALGLLAFSRWYKGNVSVAVITILMSFVFVAPYALFLFSDGHSKTYQSFQNKVQERNVELETEKEKECTVFKQKMSEYREGQPMPVPPPGCY